MARIVQLLLLVFLLVCVVTVRAGVLPGNGVASPTSPVSSNAAYTALGVTPGHLSNLWWEWNTNSAISESGSPPTMNVDAFTATGSVDCTPYLQTINGQSVLFLTGQLITGAVLPPITRTCTNTIPPNTYIYVPILNAETDRPDPIPSDHPLSFPGCLSPRSSTNPTGATNPMLATFVDGVPIGNPVSTWTVSDPELFTVQSLSAQAIADGYTKIGDSFFPGPRWIQSGGYYALIAPLGKGAHEVHIDLDAFGICGLPRGIVKFQLTYHFNVGA